MISPASEHPRVAFRPDAFEVVSVEEAMARIVNPEAGITTTERWEKGTWHLVDEIGRFLDIRPGPATEGPAVCDERSGSMRADRPGMGKGGPVLSSRAGPH